MSQIKIQDATALTRINAVMEAITNFAYGRPGFDSRNYSDARSYNADRRRASQQLNDYLAIAHRVWSSDICASQILDQFGKNSRLRVTVDSSGDKFAADYCTGQYFCTEFRAAAAQGMADLLWNHWRDSDATLSAVDLRKKAAYFFGRGIANRYFN